jgi:sugar lactone lactonase YvrE
VVRYAPDGSISGSIALPATQPTCVAFGGDQLNLLFVTSARESLSTAALAQQPQAGDVLIYQVEVQGLPESRYLEA